MESNIKNKVLKNMIWRFFERCSAQFVQFVVSVVLARVLEPEAFGTVSLVLVFAQILQVFVDSGLGNALIQKKSADELDFSSVFYFNVIWCLVLYFIIFFAAPGISCFYQDLSLTPIIRILCLTVVISGLKNVQQAYVSKTLQFKKFFLATLGGTIASAVTGITLALQGFGIWALVAQKLVNLLIDTLVLWITVEWRPKRIFSWRRLKSLIGYGWKLLASSLLNTIYDNLNSVVIGKKYSPTDLSYYNRGNQFPNLIVNNINSSIDSVLLPVMSNEQNDKNRVKEMVRKSIKTGTYIIAPLLLGLAFCADSVVEIVLTERWLPCVPFLRIFCITYMFYPIHTANLNALKAMGRSDLFLKLEIMKKVVGIILLVISMQFGVMAMAYSTLISSLLSQIINTWPNRTLLNYGYEEQLKDILPNILLASAMGVIVLIVGFLKLPVILTLIFQVIVGAAIYTLGSIVFKFESFIYLWKIVKKCFIKKRGI